MAVPAVTTTVVTLADRGSIASVPSIFRDPVVLTLTDADGTELLRTTNPPYVPRVGENVLVGGEWMSAVLRAGGLSDRVIGLAMDLFALYIGAVSYEDSLEAGQGGVEEFQAFIAQLRGYYAALPVDRFPNLQSLAGALTAEEDRFLFGVDVILAGLEAVDRASSHQ